MKVAELEQSHFALQMGIQNLIITVKTLQANLKEMKGIMTKLAMNLGHLLKNLGKHHEEETIYESTLEWNPSQYLEILKKDCHLHP